MLFIEGSGHRRWSVGCHRSSSSVHRLHRTLLISTLVGARPQAARHRPVAVPGPSSPPPVHDDHLLTAETPATRPRPHPHRDGSACLRAVVRRRPRQRRGARYVDVSRSSDEGSVVSRRQVLAAGARRQRPGGHREGSSRVVRVHRRLADGGVRGRPTAVRSVRD